MVRHPAAGYEANGPPNRCPDDMRTPQLLLLAAVALLVEACGSAHTPARAWRIYVTDEASGALTVIEGPDGKVLTTAPLGKRPRGVRVSPDGRRLYIALSGSPAGGPGVDESKLPPPDRAADGIGVFDAFTLKPIRTLRGVTDPEQLALSPDGRRLFVASEDSGQLVMMDADTGAVTGRWAVGGEPEGVAVSPDGSSVYVTSESDGAIAVIHPDSPAVAARIKVGERPRGLAVSRDGSLLFATSEADGGVWRIDTRQAKVTSHTKLADPSLKPMAVELSSDERSLYVTTGRGGRLLVLDAATLQQKAALAVGARPWGAALSPDGAVLYTANGPSNDVAVVDTAHMMVLGKIASPGKPWGVAVGPAAK